MFDLLIQPDPVLDAEQREEVKGVARKLMRHIEERLVLDWRRKAQTREAARPGQGHPRGAARGLRRHDVGAQGGHRLHPHARERPRHGHSVPYEAPEEAAPSEATAAVGTTAIDVEAVTTSVLERIKVDAAFAELVAEQLRGADPHRAGGRAGGLPHRRRALVLARPRAHERRARGLLGANEHTRALPEIEIEDYVREHWSSSQASRSVG